MSCESCYGKPKSNQRLCLMKENILIVCSSIITFLIMYMFITSPVLDIDLSSNIKNGTAYLYTKKELDGGYSNNYRSETSIVNGRQNLKFELPNYTDNLRLDLADNPFEIEIHKIQVVVIPFVRLSIYKFSGSSQVKAINYNPEGIYVVTNEDATDPMLFFDVDARYIDLIRLSISCFFGLGILVFYKLIQFNRIKFIYILDQLENKMHGYYLEVKKYRFKLSEFGTYFVMAFIFHAFEISNLLLSVDDEYSAFRVTPEAWLNDGRWTGFFIEKFLFVQPTMPFIPNLISCALMALSYMLILRAHVLTRDWRVYFLYPIYVAFPILWFINEFYGNMVLVAVGFFMTSLAILVFSKKNYIAKLTVRIQLINTNILISAILLAIAIGAYQSFIMLFLAYSMGLYVFNAISSPKKILDLYILRYLVNVGLYVMYGLITYLTINVFLKYLFPSNRSYIDGFVKNVDLKVAVAGTIKTAFDMYSGSPSIFGVSINSLAVLSIMAISIIIYYGTVRHLSIILSGLLLLLTPFLLNIITGGADSLPTRSYVAIPYVVWLMALFVISRKKLLSNIVGLLIVLIVLIDMMSALGSYAASTQIGQLHDRALADSLYERIADSNPNFSVNEVSPIDIYGYKSIQTVYPTVKTSTLGASFFDWDGGNIYRMLSYMKLIGYPNLQPVRATQMKENIEEFKKMNVWPSTGSVKYINGMYLIKLSVNPDRNHRD